MKFTVLTIFPQVIQSYISESILKRAQKKGLVEIDIVDIRKFAVDKHKTVDDRPYGGGPGMIFKIEPIYKALKSLGLVQEKNGRACRKNKKTAQVIIFDPKGKVFDQKMAKSLSKNKHLILICGRYEGFDERIYKFIDQRISIGNYVLSGGELPSLVVIEAVARLIPYVLGKKESLEEETFIFKDYKEYPQYTRPETFKGLKAPKILLSGDHKKIKEWKNKMSA